MAKMALHWQILAGMLLGAAVGLTFNFAAGDSGEVTVPAAKLPKSVARVTVRDTPNLVTVRITDRLGTTRVLVVDGTRKQTGYVLLADGTKVLPDGTRIRPDGTRLAPPEGQAREAALSFVTVAQLAERDPQAYAWFKQYGRSWSRWVGDASQRLGGLFLRMLRMVAVPLIVTSLVTGVLGLGHAERLGRMFGRTLVYYISTSMLAIIIGITMVNLIRPGLRQDVAPDADAETAVSGDLGEVLFNQIETMIPANPIGALAEGNFLSIICFSLAFAIFAIIVGGRTLDLMREFFSASFDVMMAMTLAIIKLAPLGVLFLMLYVTATQGVEVFQSLAWYMLTVICALAFHALVTLPLILHFVARRRPLEFAQAMSPALLTAFSSASSNGTLPLTLASVEERAGVSNRVSSFVLPLGATVNMDGTALYEAVAVLFIAQLHGIDLSLTQQVMVAFTALLASIGAAGIPHAGLVMMVIILQVVGLPLESQGIIIAVDRVLDMCRTSVNVWSDSCGCAVIARLEASGDVDAAAEQEQPMELQP